MQTYTIKAKIKFVTDAKTINQAVCNLYQRILPPEAFSFDEDTDSMMISYNYLDAILIEEITV